MNNRNHTPSSFHEDTLMRVLDEFRPIETVSDLLKCPPENKRKTGLNLLVPYVVSSSEFRQFRSEKEREKTTKQAKEQKRKTETQIKKAETQLKKAVEKAEQQKAKATHLAQ